MHRYPLVRLPHSMDTILFLISQELKIRKLFDGLHKAGFDDCSFEPHLGTLILSQMGLDDGKDETTALYCNIIEKRIRKIEPDHKSIMRQAMKVYEELKAESRKRKAGSVKLKADEQA
jgi:hypothetical protein